MNQVTISVIVPAHNVERYLECCVQSIQNQTHTSLEIILVNDGSTDRTGHIADALAQTDSRIRVIHQSNGGAARARLTGVQASSGSWIGFIDADDWIEPDFYERLLGNAISHSADISHCGYRMVFPDGRTNFFYNTGKTIVFDQIDGLKNLLDGAIIEPSLCTKLFRAELFVQLPKIDCSIRHNEDLLLNYHLFSRAMRSVYEDFCPYHYRIRPNSATTSAPTRARLEDPIRVSRLLQKEASCIPELRPILETRLIRQLIQGATISTRVNKKLTIPFRSKCRKELRKEISHQLFRHNLSLKIKLQALWAAVFPGSYALIHWIYLKLTGKDKLYAMK